MRRWTIKRNCGYVACKADDFGSVDPFPGQKKICQCSTPRPTPTPAPNTLSWRWCANEGGVCECGEGSIVRFGKAAGETQVEHINTSIPFVRLERRLCFIFNALELVFQLLESTSLSSPSTCVSTP